MTQAPIRIAIAGLGKIARDAHLPALAASADFTLVATASPDGAAAADVPAYTALGAMLAAEPGIEAVAVCTPPQVRRAVAMEAIAAGKNVLLEKPPAATLAEAEALIEAARAAGVTLFAAWHSRYAPAVEPARAWLAGKAIRRVSLAWKEDIRHWHPGQDWILAPGGMGVFDPAINALSIATALLPRFHVASARLAVPEGRHAPLAGSLLFGGLAGPFTAELDFLQTGPQSWDIAIETDQGTITLSLGGARLAVDGVEQVLGDAAEYPPLYARFARLIRTRASEVDLRPLQLVADAFMVAEVEKTAPFAW
ncbi:MAG: Gfo/Idh/MocA family oxidoreductase [Sphingomonadales bacterium]|nr:Gfo/Idh/MocA family oxidoreductase [Sphingomonadales bacterium]